MFKPKYQGSQHRNNNKQAGHLSTPPNSLEQTILCRVVQSYDAESLGSVIPKNVEEKLMNNPGMVWATCQTIDGANLVLPFKDTPDHLYSVYGNTMNMQGILCRIHFTGKNPSAGKLTPFHYTKNKLINSDAAADVADIGGVL